MKIKVELLETLKERLKELKLVTSKSFDTSEQLQKYVKENIHIYEEARETQAQIRQLEYELKTPEEKEEHDEYLRKLQLKSEGKSLI